MATSAQLDYNRSGDIDKLLEDVLLSDAADRESAIYARVCKRRPVGGVNGAASAPQRCQSYEVLESLSVFQVHPPPAPGERPAESKPAWDLTTASGGSAGHRKQQIERHQHHRQHHQQAQQEEEQTLCVSARQDEFAVNGSAGMDKTGSDVHYSEYTEIAALRPIGKCIQTLPSHRVCLSARPDRRGISGVRRSLHQSEPALQTQSQPKLDEITANVPGPFPVGNLRAATLQASAIQLSEQHQQQQHQQQNRVYLQNQPRLQRNLILERAIAQVTEAETPFTRPPPLPAPQANDSSIDSLMESVKATSHLWYKPTLSRDDVSSILREQPPGSFLVRCSASHPGSYDLGLRVPLRESASPQVRHFLLDSCRGGGGVRVRGTDATEFPSLAALVAAGASAAGCPAAFPCCLRLPTRSPALSMPPECTALYLAAVDVETATGAAAIARATDALMRTRQRSGRPTACRLRATSDGGVRICGDGDAFGVEKYIQAACIVHCGYDPALRSYNSEDAKAAGHERPRIFGLVLRKRADTGENTAILLCDFLDQQRAESLVQFVRQRLGL